MHIVYVNLLIEYYSPATGGALSTCIMEQGKRVMARGHDVTVLTRMGDGETHDVGRVVPVHPVERHELSPPARAAAKVGLRLGKWDWPYYGHYVRSVRRALASLRPRPDALISQNDLQILPRVARAAPGALRVAYVQNLLETRRPDLVWRHDLLVGVSGYVRDWLVARYGLPRERVTGLVHGANVDTFRPRAGFDAMHAADQPVRVLFVGRLVPEKGPDLALEALAAARRAGRRVELTVAGAKWWHGSEQPDEYTLRLRRLADEAGATMAGLVNRHELPALVRSHDVLLMPSRWPEPCGLVQFEAMASGLAVIAGDRGGIPETVGDAAVLCDPDRPGAFADALLALVSDPAAMAERKRRSLERAREMTWDHNVDTLLHMLGSIQQGAASRRTGVAGVPAQVVVAR